MSFVRRLGVRQLWAPIVALVMILTFATMSLLLLRDTSAPVGATPLAAGSSSPAVDEQVPSDAAEAEQTPAKQTSAEQTPAGQTLAEQAPRGPAAPNQVPDEPTADQTSASEQSTFKSRRALETIDPRELLRQGAVPQANVLK
jgi:hypothetical protein